MSYLKKESLCSVGLRCSIRQVNPVVSSASFASDCRPSRGFLSFTDLLGTGDGALVVGEACGVGKKDDLILWKSAIEVTKGNSNEPSLDDMRFTQEPKMGCDWKNSCWDTWSDKS